MKARGSYRFPALAILGVMSLTGFAPRAQAHGDLHERIAALTAAIDAAPADGPLYLQRAELHRAHEDYPAALSDYDRAESLIPKDTRDVAGAIDYGRGMALAAMGRDAEAEASLDRCLARDPSRYDAFAARARVRARRGKTGESAADYDRAIALSPAAEPDYLLERARLLAGATPPQLERAAAGLRDALERTGCTAPLALELCEIEMRRGKVDAALAVIDRLRSGTRRQESWLARRGELLLRAGRRDEAEASFREALSALEALSPRLRGTAATRELEESLRSRIAAVPEQN
jgi:tetratricopeptide (TPR) repeat protein